MKYSTSFATDETPLSESGAWRQGGVTGLDWTNVITSGGGAYGTEDPVAADFKDSIACLQGLGSWGTHQRCRGTLKITGASTDPPFIEAELLLHFSIAANSASGYEVTISNATNDRYIQINRWNGALGDFTQLSGGVQGTTGYGTVIANGDVFEFRDEGTSSVPLLKVYQNGVLLTGLTYDTTPDATKYTGGAPGVGFYDHALANSNQSFIQWDQFDATDGWFDGEVMQSASTAPSTSTTTTAQAYSTNVTQGDLLVAAGYHAGTHAGSFSDTRGNSWSVLRTITNATDGHTIDIGIAIAKDSGASTVTYTHSGDAASQFHGLIIAEIKSNFAVDKGTGTTGSSASASSGASGTTTNAFELLLGQIGSANVDGSGPASTANFLKVADAIGGPSTRWETSLYARLTYAVGTFTSSQQWSALIETLTLVATQTLLNYRFRNDDGSETTATWKTTEQTDIAVTVGQTFRLRLQVDTTGDEPSQPLTLQFRKVGDAVWTSLTSVTRIQLIGSANIAAGAATATTQQLTIPATKTGADFTAGKISDDTNPITGIDIALNGFSEFEFALVAQSAGTPGDRYEFQLTGTSMTNTVVPRITITPVIASDVPIQLRM
jgi:hypothetical protein